MASKRRLRRKSCTGKQRHATETKALAHAMALAASGRGRLYAYRCQFCHWWHVGH